MSTTMLPAQPPPGLHHHGGDGNTPAPASTMLAVLGRIGSHAGDPAAVYLYARTRVIAVHLAREHHFRWVCETADGDPPAAPAPSPVETRALHGWLVQLYRVA